MEIKPGLIALHLAEARWVVGKSVLPEELRRRVERQRRAVLGAMLPSGLFDGVVELASDAAGNPTSKLRWIRAEVVMRQLEADLDTQTDAYPSHPIEVAADAADLAALHKHALSDQQAARATAMDFSAHLEDIEAEVYMLGPLSAGDQAIFEETTFADALADLQVTAGIIAAIESSM